MESSSSSSFVEPPVVPPDSPGSSVSTRMQEEYDELLKYAVVVPTYNPHHTPGTLADSRTAQGTEDIITVTAQQQKGHDTEESEGQRTPRARTDNSGGQQLPDFGQSPITKERTQAGDLAMGFQPMFPPGGQRFTQATGSDRATQHKTTVRSAAERAYTATVDPDVAQMESMMDQWCLELKRNVLAEFSQAKQRVVINSREELQKETERFASDRTSLVMEMDTMKELLNTFEQSTDRKDTVISNLTTALHRHRDKMELMRKFCDWKAQHNDAKRESFASNLARKHYERSLYRRVMTAWFSLIHNKWRHHVEKACQTKAQEVCLQLTADYEAKIASLNEALESSRQEVQRLHVEREHYQEAMKKAFMRGVCALNMEAMSMFHEDVDENGKPVEQVESEMDINFSNNMDGGHPHKVISTAKLIPQDSEDHPVKIVTSQGSRSLHSQSQPRQSTAKPSSSTSSVSSLKQGRVVSGHVAGRSGDVGRSGGRSVSPVLHPPMASVVVERHQPVTKQTIGHATATKFPKTAPEPEKFRRLAGQGQPGKVASHIQTVRVVE